MRTIKFVSLSILALCLVLARLRILDYLKQTNL